MNEQEKQILKKVKEFFKIFQNKDEAWQPSELEKLQIKILATEMSSFFENGLTIVSQEFLTKAMKDIPERCRAIVLMSGIAILTGATQ